MAQTRLFDDHGVVEALFDALPDVVFFLKDVTGRYVVVNRTLADRWTVVGLLQAGMPYREIAKQTGVSVTTIGRVARYLGAGNGGYELAARRLGER